MTESSGHIAENITHFGRVLRRAGVPVGPRQVLDAIEAVQMAGVRAESHLYEALHTTPIRTQDRREIFNQAFHVFWRDPRMLERMMAMMLPELTLPREDPDEKTSRRLAEALLNQENTPAQEPEPDRSEERRVGKECRSRG